MAKLLSKHSGTTKDNRGMQFEYFCYTVRDWGYLPNGEYGKAIVERTYEDKVFGNCAGTINELKAIMAKIG